MYGLRGVTPGVSVAGNLGIATLMRRFDAEIQAEQALRRRR